MNFLEEECPVFEQI